MATETATIRVSRATRDQLAAQARQRGIPLAVMLAQLAEREEREARYRSEREATLTDARSDSVRVEEQDWESALGDDIA